MAEERLDVVVDSSSAKRGIDVLISSLQNMAGASARAETASTKFINAFNAGISKIESAVFSLKSVVGVFTTLIGTFRQLGNEITKFQAFNSALSVTVGGAKAARVEYDFLMQMSDRLGVSITSLSHNYAQLTAAAAHSGIAVKDVRTIFESFSVAARVMHLSGIDTRLMFYSLTQMVSKGVVSMEELRRQLGEKLPGAMNIAAKSVGVAMPVLEAAIRKGSVDSAKFLPILAEAVKDTFSPGLSNAMKALDAEINRMINNLQKMILVFYDLGVADSFTKIIKEINRILSDKKIAEEFANAIKGVADNIAEFLKSISGESIGTLAGNFGRAMKTIAETITQDIMPVITKLLTHVKEIVVAWGSIKGMSLGASIGGAVAKGPIGVLGGGLVGGLVGGFATNAAINAVVGDKDKSVSQRDWRSSLSSFMPKARENVANLNEKEMMDLVSGDFKSKPKATLADVLNNQGKNKEFEAEMKRLQKITNKEESDDNIFTAVSIGIKAKAYGDLTKAQEDQLKSAAALAQRTKAMNDFEDQRAKDQKLIDREIGLNAAKDLADQEELKRIRLSFADEQTLIDEHHNAQIEKLTAFKAKGLLLEEEFDYMKLVAESKHLTESENLKKKYMTEAQKIEKMSYAERTSSVLDFMLNMTNGVAQHSKKLFEINKIAGIANIAIKTPSAIASAYEFGTKFGGPVLGAAMAGLAAASMATQMLAIKKAQFGGSSGSAPSLAGSTAAPPVTPIPAPAPAEPERRLVVSGLSGEGIISMISARQIAETLLEFQRNGGVVVLES